MRNVERSRKFKKEFKRCLARGLDELKFQRIVTLLASDQSLSARCRPHKLEGIYSGYWECHITPDWLLVYHFPDDETQELLRTGTHSDLF